MKNSGLLFALFSSVFLLPACYRSAPSAFKTDPEMTLAFAVKSGDEVIHSATLPEWVERQRYAVLDLRSRAEYDKGHLAAAINVPLAQLLETDQWKQYGSAPGVVLVAAQNADMAGAWLLLKQLGLQDVKMLAPDDSLMPEVQRYPYAEIFRLATERHAREIEAGKVKVEVQSPQQEKKIIRPRLKTPAPAEATHAKKQEEGC